jgi:hypothetical protein
MTEIVDRLDGANRDRVAIDTEPAVWVLEGSVIRTFD